MLSAKFLRARCANSKNANCCAGKIIPDFLPRSEGVWQRHRTSFDHLQSEADFTGAEFENHVSIFVENLEMQLNSIFSHSHRINEQFELISDVRIESDGNFLNKSIISRVDKSSIPNPSTIACVLEINGTNYEKRQQLVYYDKNYDKRYSVKFQRFMSDIWSRAGNMQNEKFKISLVLMVVNLMKLL